MQTSKRAIVTGATGAIGKAIARQLAQAGYNVMLACRNEAKAEAVVAEIRRLRTPGEVRFDLVDVSRHASIQALRERWEGPLDVLVNNAAATARRREETSEGIELQFATNVLGYFWMTNAFADVLTGIAGARVVNVASYWAGGLDLDDPEFKRRRYDNDTAYRQSKQADRMLSAKFAALFADHGIAVNACHPGDVNSTLSNNLGFGGHETPDQGADTPVWLATTSIGTKASGKYFEHRRESPCRFSSDQSAVETLYDLCATY